MVRLSSVLRCILIVTLLCNLSVCQAAGKGAKKAIEVRVPLKPPKITRKAAIEAAKSEPMSVTWQALDQLAGHNKDVWQVAFSPNRFLLLSSGDDNRIIAWDINSGQIAKSIPHADEKHGLAFSASPDFFAVCYSTPFGPQQCGQARLMNLHTGTVVMEAPSLRGGCFHRVDIHSSGSLMAAGGWDSSVMVWGIDSVRMKMVELIASPALPESVLSLRINPSRLNLMGHQIAVGCRNGQVVLLEANSAAGVIHSKTKVAGHSADVSCVQYNPGGEILATSDTKGNVRLWESMTGKQIRHIDTNENTAESLAFSPNGKLLTVGHGDGKITVWSVGRGEKLAELTGHTKAVLCVAFHPDGELLASASRDYTVRLWKLAVKSAQPKAE